jgi:hypothetical protein
MYIDMNCSCTASFSVDSDENDTLAMLWANQFINSHQSCGFMTKATMPVEESAPSYEIIYKEQREKEL